MSDILINQITEAVIKELNNGTKDRKIKIGVSARHVHLCRKALDILFGEGYELTEFKELMGGQYAAKETVTIIGEKMQAIEKVRILGPLRKASQVEVSFTDALKLGVKPPVRESGNTKGSSPISIIGPKGCIYLKEGCIIAKRHIHMSLDDAKRFNVEDGQMVRVKFDGERGGIFENVQIRTDKTYTLEMHIDTDEANCFGIKNFEYGEVL